MKHARARPTLPGNMLAWRTGLWTLMSVYWLDVLVHQALAMRALHQSVRVVTWFSLCVWAAMLPFWLGLGWWQWRTVRQRRNGADFPPAG